MTKIVAADAAGIEEAVRLLAVGELVAFPTETFYGLAADARSDDAAAKVFAAKGRPADSPVALIAHDLDSARSLASGGELPPAARELAAAFWPGPLTLVIHAAEHVPAALTAGTGTIGVRISPHPVAAALASRFAITATSANVTGRPPLTGAREVAAELPGIALVLDGGRTPGGLASTLVDLTQDPPRILRTGPVSAEALKAILPGVRS